jgi:Carbohydrate family 9 binding domain-like
VSGSAKLLWDDKNLYVFYEVKEVGPYVGFTDAKSQPGAFTVTGQPKLWTKDTVEMMVEPDAVGDNHDYYELQINPQNKVFKSQFDALQQPSGGPDGPFGHEDWDPKLKSAVELQKGPDGVVRGYNIEIAIPWAAYGKAANHPPKPGDVWRINFYAMKDNGGVSWSPILGQGNFHKASRFGRVTWEVAGAPGAAAPSIAPTEAKASPAGPSDGSPRFMQMVHRPIVPKVPAVP